MKNGVIKAYAIVLALACAMSVSSLAATITSSSSQVGTSYLQLNVNAPEGAEATVNGSTLVTVQLWKKVSKIVGANWSYPPTYSYRYSMPSINCEGYHLCGWYSDAELTTVLVISAEERTINGTVDNPTQAYAKWGALEAGNVTTEPACEETGKQAAVCAECAKTVSITIPALGHNLVHATTVLPTYTQDGYTTDRCTRCDYTETEVLPCNGAELVEQITVVYDSMNGTIRLENIPANINVMVAAYSGERMVYTENYAKPDEAFTITLPEAVAGMGVKLFFLDNQWIPLGECKTLR